MSSSLSANQPLAHPQSPVEKPVTPAPPMSEEEAADRLEELWADPPGFIGWFRSLQNDAVGGRIMVTAFTFFLIGGLMSLLIRTQLMWADNDMIGADRYNELFTMHGSTMMYLLVVPMIEGIAIFSCLCCWAIARCPIRGWAFLAISPLSWVVCSFMPATCLMLYPTRAGLPIHP